MAGSIWTQTLAAFRDELAGVEPAPAGVTASMVTATLGLSLLVKVLEITRRRRDSGESAQRLATLLDAARHYALQLAHDADKDVIAVSGYINSLRLPKTTDEQRNQRRLALEAAMRRAIDVPMWGARSVGAALDLTAEAATLVQAWVAADVGAAAALLCGASRAMLVSVDSNLQHVRFDEKYYNEIMTERTELEKRALQQATTVQQQVALIASRLIR
jgi:formiminotetrahydrofolate cyclodeaminase